MDALARRAAVEQARQKATEADEKVFLEIVREETARLGKPCRELLVLRVRQNLSYGELSAKLKIPIGTVMSRLARCKEALKTRVLKAAGRKGILDE
jgi:RNA polymerase sigma-70 factor (ECF subfamily)